MAFLVLAALAVMCAAAAAALFLLHAFSYVIAVALTVVFALGAGFAKVVHRASPRHV